MWRADFEDNEFVGQSWEEPDEEDQVWWSDDNLMAEADGARWDGDDGTW